VIVRGVGKRNENAGQLKGRDLGQAGRARARNCEIGGAVNFFHMMMKRGDVSGDSFAAIIFRDLPFITRAGEMNDLERRVAEERQRFDNRLINSARALTSTHHQHRCDIAAQSEFLPGRLSIQAFELVPNRRAGQFGAHFGKKRGAFFEAEQNRAHHSCREPIRFPGDRIRFVNERGNSTHPAGQNRRGRSESTHAENDLRFKFLIN